MTRASWMCLAAVALGCGGGDEDARDPRFAIAVAAFEPGEGAGFGMDRFPDVVLGPPRGRGSFDGSTDVLSLGRGGSIVVEVGTDIVDGDGADFVVFENAFYPAGTMTPFADPGFVAVSEDGETFVELACGATDAPDYPGCAGIEPVYANVVEGDASVDPFGPDAGGDGFDLAAFGVARARFVRIRDSGEGPRMGGDTEGFDLDAVGVVPR